MESEGDKRWGSCLLRELNGRGEAPVVGSRRGVGALSLQETSSPWMSPTAYGSHPEAEDNAHDPY